MEEKVVGPKGQLRPKNPFKSMEMSLGVLTGEREEEFVDDEHRLAYENEKRVVHRFDKEKERYVQEVTTRKELMAGNRKART